MPPWLSLLAQEVHLPASPTTAIGALIAVVLALTGLLVWLLRHVFTVTIPTMQQTFRDEMAAERRSCKEQFDAALDRIDQTLDVLRGNQEEYRKNQEEWRLRWQKAHGNT